MKPIDLHNQTFWLLTVSKLLPDKKWWQRLWECICECWKITNVVSRDLRSGNTTSCWCFAIRYRKDRYTVHWQSKTRFWKKYKSIIERCSNPKNKSYPIYWWRGIQCEWATLNDFYIDMYESYSAHVSIHWPQDTTIDRIDVNGNYCKENCRWATRYEQSENTRRNVLVNYKWEMVCYTRAIIDLLWSRSYSSKKDRNCRTHQQVIDDLISRNIPRSYIQASIPRR